MIFMLHLSRFFPPGLQYLPGILKRQSILNVYPVFPILSHILFLLNSVHFVVSRLVLLSFRSEDKFSLYVATPATGSFLPEQSNSALGRGLFLDNLFYLYAHIILFFIN